MLLLGRIVFYFGLFLTIISIIAGFSFMFSGVSNWAQFCFMAVPLGFLLLFAGLSTNVLLEPRSNEKN